MVVIVLVLLSAVWALHDSQPSKLRTTLSISPTLVPEMIPLVTGDEPILEMFTRAGCSVCHIIPGIPDANGRVGPPLILGTTGMERLNDPTYQGSAKSVHDYIVESVLDPQRFIVQGYPEQTMPAWYGSKLSALALEKIAAYLEHQAGESLTLEK